MSEFYPGIVVRVGDVEKHPNADTLSITKVLGGYPVIFRTGQFRPGDLAVYLSEDCVVPSDRSIRLVEESDSQYEARLLKFAFLNPTPGSHTAGKYNRIGAKRLRGVFSMGVLIEADPGMQEGELAAERWGIQKWEPPITTMSGDDARDPGGVPCYDIEGYRRHPSIFQLGEPVWITEKIDGCNFRAVWKGGLLHVGSHTRFKKPETPNLWWQSIKGLDLEDKLRNYPDLALFGEVYGQVGGMDYGVLRNSGTRLVLFDAMDLITRRWYDVDEFLDFCQKLALPVVPTLYRGPWIPSLTQLADGMTTLGGNHIREGIVIKPLKERFCEELGGRCFLKLPGEKYLEKKHRR